MDFNRGDTKVVSLRPELQVAQGYANISNEPLGSQLPRCAANMKHVCVVAMMLTCFPTATPATDIDNGRDIALRQCAACHSVTRPSSREVADAPPFEVIGRKNGFDPGSLAFALLDPHPKMNFALTRREAADVAAYISSLGN